MKKNPQSKETLWKYTLSVMKEEYKAPVGHISFKLVTLIPFAPVIGFTYLVFYFSSFNGFSYDELDFSINDCIAIMYSKGLILFSTVILTLVCLMPILSGILDFFSQKETQRKVTNWVVLGTAIICLIIMVIMLTTLKIIPPQGAFSLTILLIIALLFYLFKDKNQGIILGVVFSALFCVLIAKEDAQKIKQKKPKFQITIKDKHGEPIDILSEKDICKYYIKKTTNTLYIMNECKKTVDTYQTSDIISISVAYND
ncbi:hypothetical protein [Elizabethkingia anophelis]|uniref:hypothetical protein n=1 Tax=Elizabethkingia anophelis TaxID=1117645 RepID=UPI0020B3F14B|nr:hypothetical protein [Elizabethkingia anophelis]MCT4306164.1 hypothetical protein [Elizabethkingia anophelis]MDV3831795.1 hypothetical protein [Elizabethkingia anophelis]UTF95130.1 hypothetical protein J2N94_09975 [Elizabethkingia anophelis]